MKVILAGHTVDKGIIRQVAQGRIRHDTVVSPESIAAAYGRISRYPTPAPELRRITREDVASARRSNRIIIFKMGHRAVAEHVLFNFDILGISRLALEALEEARLCTCTEKSQRHIESENSFVIPAEFSETQRQLLQRVVEMQAALQNKLFNPLLEHYRRLHPDMRSKRRDVETVEGWALNDAAYAAGLCTQAQLGFSGNARSIEYLIRKLRHHKLAEVRELGQLIFNGAASAAPSLIELSDPDKYREAFGAEPCDDHMRLYRDTLRSRAESVMADATKDAPKADADNPRDGDVTLVGHTPEPDVKLAASLLAAAGPSRPYGDCLEAARDLGRRDDGRLRAFILEAMRHLCDSDPAPREFETVSFTFEIICSATCFARLQRHRMMTVMKQDYDPQLGLSLPDSIIEIGQKDAFEEVAGLSADAYYSVRRERADAAQYMLTAAHRRRVVVECNLRELYHIAGLHMDPWAQWDIRRISASMAALANRVAPIGAGMACGRHAFEKMRRALLGESRSVSDEAFVGQKYADIPEEEI